jgi:membrane protein required for colicin V production
VLDFLLGLYLAVLLVRGWMRGFVRELMDLVGLVVGAALAFRLSGPVGGFLSDRFGAGPEVARIAAGIALFLLFGVAAGIGAHLLSRVMELPGLSLINRVFGAAVAGAWGILLVLVAVMVVSVLPVPRAVDDQIEGSAVAQAIAGPDSVPRRVLDPLVADHALTALAAIEEIVGGRRIVPLEGERVETRPVPPDQIRIEADATGFVADRVNADRLEAGVDPLTWSEGLADLARRRAVHLYRKGVVLRRGDERVLAATAGEGLTLGKAAEMVALASSERAAHVGIAEATDSALPDPAFNRVGVAVVSGPLGSLVVEVYGR